MRKPTKRTSLVIVCAMAFAFGDVETASSSASVTAKENLEKLIETNSCKGCDLSGLNLNRMEFSGADLEGADLSLAKLYLTNLSGANLKNATLTGAVFGGADLGDADLRGADLRGTSLEGAYLGGTLLDGEFVTSKPYENIGVTEVEKDVYVGDQAKPKRNPEQKEVKVAARRDFEEPPPPLAEKQSADIKTTETEPEQTVKAAPAAPAPSTPKPPPEKKVSPVQEVVVASYEDPAPAKVEESTMLPKSEVRPETPAPPAAPAVGGDDENQSESLAEEKAKRDNLSRLFDTDKCYGCDLSGLDLSGKNLDGADLEKADLSGCDLEKVDLEDANLKGALLVKANLRNAKLKGADLYKADLTEADLTGADVRDAMFDGAKVSDTIGFSVLSIMDNK